MHKKTTLCDWLPKTLARGRDRRFCEEKYFNIIGSDNSIVYALSSDFRFKNHYNTSFHEYLAPRAKNETKKATKNNVIIVNNLESIKSTENEKKEDIQIAWKNLEKKIGKKII